jgi:chemotaxis protein CheX
MRLPAILDLKAATPLWNELCAARGQALQVDASAVERLGGLCLQALLAARAQWQSDGLTFAIINPSPAFSDAANLMAPANLTPREAA